MKLLDKYVIARLFQKNPEGKNLFVPYGKWGKKYEVTEDQEKQLYDFLRIFYLIALPILILSGIFFGGYIFMIAIPLALTYFIKVFAIVEPGLSPKDRFNIEAIIEHFLDVIGIEGVIVGAVAGAIVFLLNLKIFFNSSLSVLGLLGIIFSGVCLFFLGKYLYEYYTKKSDKNDKKEEVAIEPEVEKSTKKKASK